MLMPTIPGSFAELLGAFRACFTAPTFTTFTALCAGLLAQPGPGTVTGMLAGARLAGIWHHARAHRFFTSARWRPDHLGVLLCDLIVGLLLGPDQPILLAIDDTLFHRASRRLPLAAFHHDPTAPAGRRIGWGHCWVVVGILVKLPFVPHRQVCLPVLARLWHPRDADHTKLVLAHQMIRLVAARYPNRQVDVVADAAYAGKSPLGLPRQVTLTSRLRRDAALHALPTARQPSQRGRPRRKGDRLPTLERLADLPTTTWQQATVRRYGKRATVTLAAITCLWYHVHRARPVQVVLVREHGHDRGFDLALVSTDLKATPSELVERYSARWAIEVTFLESKHLVGVGQARNRRRLAVQRTVPFGLCCHSLLVIWYTLNGHAAGDVATRRALAPWYRHKHTPSTLDMLVTFRRAMLTEYHHTHPAQPTSAKLTDALLTWDLTAA
jgi:SRSO17 transposase